MSDPQDSSHPAAHVVAASDPVAIARAAHVLRRGGLIGFPTETVYGLGADATNADAVRRIFAVKGRPEEHPLIVHIADGDALAEWTLAPSDLARALAAAFWPGPLTMILRRHPRVPLAVTGGLETVGVRVPAHPVALALLRAFGGAVAAPSANRFGRVSPTTAEHVGADLGSDVELILDGGSCSVGVESTIVDLTEDAPAILRPGGVTREQLERALGIAVPPRDEGGPRAPGRLPSHYAPRTPVQLVRPDEVAARVAALTARGARVGLLDLVGASGALSGDVVRVAAPARDLATAARLLYAGLRQLDAAACAVIVAVVPDEAGLGSAIADRLRRAAAGADEPDTP